MFCYKLLGKLSTNYQFWSSIEIILFEEKSSFVVQMISVEVRHIVTYESFICSIVLHFSDVDQKIEKNDF